MVGTSLTACTTAEILAGKIIGRALIPFRDVFDAAVAVLKEPQAMDKALRIADEYPISGRTAIERIPQYCRRITATEDWKRERGMYIQEPQCVEAWENGPQIVEATVEKWCRKRDRTMNRTKQNTGWER